jgi:DNA-binding beta-propeller fold protein YncE
MITSGVSDPWGLYVDKNGNLYVANQTNTVTVYPPGSVYPSATYSQGLCHPLFPIVDRQGDLFVANGRSCGSGPATVEYLPGSTNPYHVLQIPATEVDGLDFDGQQNLYVAYCVTSNRGHGSIEKFAPGSPQGQILGMTVHKPQGLIVDAEGNILMVDTSRTTRDVVVYAPGARHPNARVKLPKGSIPNQIAITKNEDKLFVTSYNDGYVYVTNYPLTRYSTWTVIERPGSIIQGVALSNGQVF